MKYWKIIAENLSKAGWSWGCVATVDAGGRTIWIADANRGDGKRFVVQADEKMTAFCGTRSGDSGLVDLVENTIDLSGDAEQSCARAKSVRRLPLELHLTLFPQGNPCAMDSFTIL